MNNKISLNVLNSSDTVSLAEVFWLRWTSEFGFAVATSPLMGMECGANGVQAVILDILLATTLLKWLYSIPFSIALL